MSNTESRPDQETVPGASLDLRGVACPLKEEGHRVVKVEALSGNSFRLMIEKDGGTSNG